MTSGHDGYALLSIVAQAFALVVFLCMCAGEDVPPMRAGFPTWTHRHRSSDGADPLLGQRVCALRER
jgi:hypothetical protein